MVQGQGQATGQLQVIPHGVTVIPGPGQQLMQAALPNGQVQRFLFTPLSSAATPSTGILRNKHELDLDILVQIRLNPLFEYLTLFLLICGSNCLSLLFPSLSQKFLASQIPPLPKPRLSLLSRQPLLFRQVQRRWPPPAPHLRLPHKASYPPRRRPTCPFSLPPHCK